MYFDHTMLPICYVPDQQGKFVKESILSRYFRDTLSYVQEFNTHRIKDCDNIIN